MRLSCCPLAREYLKKIFIKVIKSPYFAPIFFFALSKPKPLFVKTYLCTSNILTSINIYCEQPNLGSKELRSILLNLISKDNYEAFCPFGVKSKS